MRNCVAALLLGVAGSVASAATAPGFNFGGKDQQPDALRRVLQLEPGSKALSAVEIFSGADGSMLTRFSSTEPNDLFGFAASSAGDLDGDGFDDVVVGAPLSGAGGQASGRVDVYSAVSGSIILSIPGTSHEMLGLSVQGVGDVDGDNVPDLAAMGTDGRGAKRMSHVTVFSGSTGARIATYVGGEPGDNFGTLVTRSATLDKHGHAQIAILAPSAREGASVSLLTPQAPNDGGMEVLLLRQICEDPIDIVPVDGVIDILVRLPNAGQGTRFQTFTSASNAMASVRDEAAFEQYASDVNHDGVVDELDMALVGESLQRVVEDATPISSDVNGDGFTDASDLADVAMGVMHEQMGLSPAAYNALRQREEQHAILESLARTMPQSDEGGVIQTLLASCGGCTNRCPDGQGYDPATKADGTLCARCRCCGNGYWDETLQDNTQQTPPTGTARQKGSTADANGGNAYVQDTVPFSTGWFSSTTNTSGNARATWSSTRTIAWKASTGPNGQPLPSTPCAYSVYLQAWGSGGENVSVSCDADTGISATASASGSGSCSSIGNASATIAMTSITLQASFNAGTTKVDVSGNAGGQVTDNSASCTGSYSAATSFSTTGTGSASGSASYAVKPNRTHSEHCRLSGYTKQTSGSVGATGSGNGTAGFWAWYFATYDASSNMRLGV